MIKDRIFEQYQKMLDDLHSHVSQAGFHLEHWTNGLRAGFKCAETNTVWHMNAAVFLEQVPSTLKPCFDTDEGKAKYLDVLRSMLSLPLFKPDGVCQAYNCDKPSNPKKEGMCGWCYRKYQKGLLDAFGNKVRTWDEVKADVSAKLDTTKLKLFGETHPEYQATFGCDKLNLFIDPIACMNRIFLTERPKKECKKCRVHDEKIPTLEAFLDNDA